MQYLTICFFIQMVEALNRYQFSQECLFANLKYSGSAFAASVVDAPLSYVHQSLKEDSSSLSIEKSMNIIMDKMFQKYANGADNTEYFSKGAIKRSEYMKRDTISCATSPINCFNNTQNLLYRSIDGSCNNLIHPDFGMAKTRYARILKPKFADNLHSPTRAINGSPLPNARLLSLSMYGEETVGDQYRTMAAMQWGQFVAHDISMLTTKGSPVDCCTEYQHKLCYPIQLSASGPISHNTGKSCLSFARSISDADANCPKSGLPYSEKISVVTAYLDLSSLYGNSLAESNKIRQHSGGLLVTSYINHQQWLPIIRNSNECGSQSECYMLPDKRNRFTPTIILLQTLLLREHNRIAIELGRMYPYYSDEKLYQEARKINIAQYQKITYYDWLPSIVSNSFAYANGLIYYTNEHNKFVNDYDETVSAAAFAEFAAAAFRYSHTQIPGWFSLVSPNRDSNQTLRLSDYFERSGNIQLMTYGDNFEALLRGLATQVQKQSDANIDSEIKHYFNRKEFDDYGSDLKSIDIQRGRDFGLPSYNDMRQFCGLRRAVDWSDFGNEISSLKIQLLQNIYDSPDDIDLSIGGSLEKHSPGAIFGPTFLCIIGKQFLKTRRGDRFFFEHENLSNGFSNDQLLEIHKASLAGIFCNNARFLRRIQPNVFVFPNTNNFLIDCNNVPRVDLNKW